MVVRFLPYVIQDLVTTGGQHEWRQISREPKPPDRCREVGMVKGGTTQAQVARELGIRVDRHFRNLFFGKNA